MSTVSSIDAALQDLLRRQVEEQAAADTQFRQEQDKAAAQMRELRESMTSRKKMAITPGLPDLVKLLERNPHVIPATHKFSVQMIEKINSKIQEVLSGEGIPNQPVSVSVDVPSVPSGGG